MIVYFRVDGFGRVDCLSVDCSWGVRRLENLDLFSYGVLVFFLFSKSSLVLGGWVTCGFSWASFFRSLTGGEFGNLG